MMFKKNVIAVAVSGLLLSGCLSSDDNAVAEAGANINLKERRSITLTGATGTGEGAVTVVWTQVSGPELTIAGADSLSPQVTAPSVDADSSAVLRLTVTDSKGQVATDDLTVNIANNTLPTLTAQPEPVAEKSQVEITAALSDDGDITAVSWLQTAGPEVELAGADTATVTFTAPAVTEATTLTFTLSVTDDDNETAELELTVEVEPNLVAFTLAGSVSGADFSGGTAVLKGAYEDVSSEVDDNGAFSFDLQLDDDLIDSVVAVTVNSQTSSRLAYSSVYSGFTAPETVAAASVKPLAKDTKVSAASDGSNTVSVTAVSTALYSLLVIANGGAVPANIEQLVFVEKSIDADELIEAAAVVKILTDNPDIVLPEGVSDITELLTNVAAYNTVVENIETEQPGLIADTVLEIIEDPELTPPVTADAVAPVYYQTFAAAPGFLSRGGEQWQFTQDGKGTRTNRSGSEGFSWSVDDAGDITVIYADGFRVTSFRTVAVGNFGLTEEQVSWLQSDGIFQVETETRTTRSILKRISTGQQIDSFNIESERLTRVLPIQTSQGLVETPDISDISNGNILLRKQVSEQYVFSAEGMPGDWAINSFYAAQISGQTASNFYLDVLRFNADGTGIGRDTDRTFNWTVNNGLLVATFSDNSSLEARIIDVSGTDYQVFSVAKDGANKVVAAQAEYGFRVDHDAVLDWVSGSDNYWQTMINSWSKSSWDNGRLLFCSDDPQCQDPNAYIAAFGWQFLTDFTGTQITRAFDNSTLPPLFEPNLVSLNWDSQDDNADWLSIWYNIGSFSYQRSWSLLKTEQGVLGKRIYVQEQASRSNPDYGIDGVYIGSRIGMYEQIPVSYWNDTAPEASVGAASIKKTATQPQRLVVNPTKKDIGVQ